jgi:hypothetical protein
MRHRTGPAADSSTADSSTEASPSLPMTFNLSGEVLPEEVERAREVFSRVLAHAHEPVLSVQATLAIVSSHTPPSRAEASLRVDVNGRLVHAHARAASLREAIAVTADRLAAQMMRASRDWESQRGGHSRAPRGDGGAPTPRS